jgi:phage-related protein
MFVNIGADTSGFTKDIKTLEKKFSAAGSGMNGVAKDINKQFSKMNKMLSPLQQHMQSFGKNGTNSLEGIEKQIEQTTAHLDEFKGAIESGGLEMDKSYTVAQDKLNAVRTELSMLTSLTSQYGPKLAKTMTEGLQPMAELQSKQRDIKKQFAELTFDTAKFKGDTDAYIAEIVRVGGEQKKVSEEMMKLNKIGLMGITKTVGTLLNASTQSSKIAANFERMGDPIGPLNQSLLKVGDGLEKLAKQGNAAVLALKHLGPNANMKQMNDYIRMINMGLMRMTMLALGMGLVFIGVLAGINKLLEANGLTKMSDAAKELGSTLNTALLPFLKSFDAVAAAIIGAVNAVAQLWAKFSQLNPEISAAIGWFALLFIGLMVLLAPLAVGIGLTGGLTAAFSALWVVIAPFVIGFLTVAGTALVIAAALVAIGAAIYLLWTRTTWFKDAVIGIWEAIKSGTAAAWAAIVAFVTPAIDAIKAFIEEKMTQVRAFWDENGAMILQAVMNVWTAIATVIGAVIMAIVEVFKWAWPFIKVIIIGTWEAIKSIISGALNIIMGIIKFFAALFTGDWAKMWEAVKQIVGGVLEMVWGIIQQFGTVRLMKYFMKLSDDLIANVKNMWESIKEAFNTKLNEIIENVQTIFNNIVNFVLGLGKTFFDAGKGLIDQMAEGIAAAAKKVIEKVKEIAGQIRDFLPFSPAKVGPLSDLDKLDFGGPISDSITTAIPKIKGLMGEMLAMPAVTMEGESATGSESATTGDTYYLDVQLNAKDVAEFANMYEFFNTFKQIKRARGFS